ncbi:MAG: hypothetical protein ACFFCD_03360 [Promethearchaeota archaeon]
MKTFKSLTGSLRKICSLAPPRGCNSNRKPGISALVLLRNEPFVEPSLVSIKDFVNEFILVDCSTDDTPIKVKQVAKEHELNLKYIHMGMDYRKQFDAAIKFSTCEWLLKWDGDFIAYLSGKRNIRKLKYMIKNLPKEKYFFIEFPVLDVELDLLHTTKNPYHFEAYLFKYSPLLLKPSNLRKLRNNFRRVIGKRPFRSPHLPFPFWYERITLKQVFAMHLRSVKSPLRVFERKYQTDWALLSDEIKRKFSNSFEEFFQYCFKKDFNDDLEKLSQIYVKILMKERNLIPYNIEVYGDYPIVLRRMIKETLEMEISPTKEFKNKIMQLLINRQ